MCIGQDGMGLVCKKRAADGLSYLSFTTVAQLSSDKGGACIPLEKTLTHPPTPFPPSTPAQASTSTSSRCWSRQRPRRVGCLALKRAGNFRTRDQAGPGSVSAATRTTPGDQPAMAAQLPSQVKSGAEYTFHSLYIHCKVRCACIVCIL